MQTRTSFLGATLAAAAVAAPASAAPPALPDLVTESVQLTHDKAAPDTVVGVTFRVANRGNADAATFRIAVYHSDGLLVPARGNVTRVGATRAYLGLGRGQSETFQVNVRLPPCENCKPGSIYVYADAWGNVLESSGFNNFKSTPIDISAKYQPNLRITETSISPDRGSLGRMVTLGAKLTNASQYVAYGPIKLGLYCSRDFELDAKDTLLQSFTHTYLKAGESITISKRVRVDVGCAIHGQHTRVGVLADIDAAVDETDETDNGQLAPFWVFKAPDVTPGTVAILPDAGPPGTPAVVSFTVTNAGKLPVGPVDVGVYMGKSAKITTKDRRFAGRTLATLPPGKTTVTLQDNVFAPDLPSGTYYVGVIVDEKSEAGELREHNNDKAVAFKIVRPNLTDRFFFVSQAKARPGAQLGVRFSLRNLGPDTTGPFKVGFYYSDDPRYDASDVRLAEKSFDKLGKGPERGEHQLDVTLPKQARGGYRYLIMVTDSGGDVYETDELDNFALRPVMIER
jgi:hypothetical protein